MPTESNGYETCTVDGEIIRMQIFKGTGVCCERCRKAQAGEPAHER